MKIDISIGELVDRATILAIKARKFKTEQKVCNVQRELERLQSLMKHSGIKADSQEFRDLEAINVKLWDIENAIRLKEKKREFDHDFIQLARSIYLLNDERATVKRQISLKYDSEFIEEKEYVF